MNFFFFCLMTCKNWVSSVCPLPEECPFGRTNCGEIVDGADVEPTETLENTKARQKWRMKCGKALDALTSSINLIDHV